jgi:hypothetical protein
VPLPTRASVNGRCKKEIGKFGEVLFAALLRYVVSSGVLLLVRPPIHHQIAREVSAERLEQTGKKGLKAMAVAKAANDTRSWKTN